MKSKKHIVYLGCSGFPYGLAEIQKIILISKGQVREGNVVTVICKRGMHDIALRPDMKAVGNFEGVDYVYTAGTAYRSYSFFTRNILKLKGFINEFLLLRKLKKEQKLDYAILSTHSYTAVIYYVFLSKLFGFKTVLNYVEYYSSVKKKWSEPRKWLNDILYDKFAPRHTDAVFLISEFLIAHLKKIAPQKKFLKIPNLTDVERYNGIDKKAGDEYYLFCGAANYDEIVKFVIDAFGKVKTKSTFLYLVINGNQHDIGCIHEYIAASPCKDRIRFLTRLTDRELSTYYINAIGLLIPLRPTFQDMARFPHKIGEYLGSGSPVVSTNYGEVAYYFKDMENMFIADSYDVDQFAEKMQFILEKKTETNQIAMKGHAYAVEQFDYKANGPRIAAFLNEM